MRRFGGVVLSLALGGCAPMYAGGVLDPRGPVAAAEKTILFNSLAIMLAIVVPVIVLAIAFAFWFRKGNARAKRLPDWEYSGQLELLVWSVPIMVVLFLGGIGWVGSHDLDPKKTIGKGPPGLRVQVVSLDWKWLFLYPDQGVASVNRLVIPAGTPVTFEITSASVMNSFFVPQLGSQIYAMSGMTTHLNLQADKPGVFPGLSAQYSGAGFSSMRFMTVAVPPAQFQGWLAQTRGNGRPLDEPTFAKLTSRGTIDQPIAFGRVLPGLFDAVVAQRAPRDTGPPKGNPNTADPTLKAH